MSSRISTAFHILSISRHSLSRCFARFEVCKSFFIFFLHDIYKLRKPEAAGKENRCQSPLFVIPLRAILDPQICNKSGRGTVRGCQNRWGNPAAQPPHGFFALLIAPRSSNISVLSCLLRRAAFTEAIFVAFVRWSATPGNPINVLSAPRCPLACLFRYSMAQLSE